MSLLRLCLLLLLAGIVTVFYFSWLPSPLLSRSNVLPIWLAQWTDAPENDTLRTAVPFICLGFAVGSCLSATSKNWYWWLSGWISLILIALIAEAGQLILPYRNFDWNDVAWGATGSLVGLLLTGLGIISTKVIVNFCRYNTKK